MRRNCRTETGSLSFRRLAEVEAAAMLAPARCLATLNLTVTLTVVPLATDVEGMPSYCLLTFQSLSERCDL